MVLTKTRELEQFMEAHFGTMGYFLLDKKMAALGIKDVDSADVLIKSRLVDELVRDYFSAVMNPVKARIAHSQLEAMLQINDTGEKSSSSNEAE